MSIKWSVILWTDATHPSTVEVGGDRFKAAPALASGEAETFDTCRFVAFVSGAVTKGADGMFYGPDGKQVVIRYE